MNDSVYSTLLAAAALCNVHSLGMSLSLNGSELQVPEHWEQGFEQCPTILRAADAEKTRRALERDTAQRASEKKRIANAIAALEGKAFTPEDAPPDPKPLWLNGGCSMVLTSDGIAR